MFKFCHINTLNIINALLDPFIEENIETVDGIPTASSSLEWGTWISINNAIDDKIDGNFYHSELEDFPWYQYQLPEKRNISGLYLVNREDCCGERLHSVEIRAGFEPATETNKGVPLSDINTLCGVFEGPGVTGEQYKVMCENGPIEALYITIQIMGKEYLQISEIELIGEIYRSKYFRILYKISIL